MSTPSQNRAYPEAVLDGEDYSENQDLRSRLKMGNEEKLSY